eukprot:15445791-Alexandrium_andersonii.AAC.1
MATQARHKPTSARKTTATSSTQARAGARTAIKAPTISRRMSPGGTLRVLSRSPSAHDARE